VRKDVYRPEPRRLLITTFALGSAVTIPVALVEFVFLGDSSLSDEVTLGALAIGMLLVVGPAEELGKFAVVRFVPYRSLYFDEPMDGLVYGAAASLGFASLENLAYMLTFGPEVILVRGPLSTLGHLVLGSIWGYPLGQSSQKKTGLGLPVVAGLAHRSDDTRRFQHHGVHGPGRSTWNGGAGRVLDDESVQLGPAGLTVQIQAQLPIGPMRSLPTPDTFEELLLPILWFPY
jgi:hypothetical protein